VKARRPVLLLVDDEERILSALGRALRREGYELLCAEGAAEALGILEARAVDAILTDHKMPGMTGLAFLERAVALRPDAVPMLLTGWPGAIPEAALEKLGVFALLTKPWDDRELKETLRRALRT
jgi:CheY-like chemotaxis protein